MSVVVNCRVETVW